MRFLDVGFSFCCSNCRSWFSLEQNCRFIEDKLSSTTVDFIRSEGIAERQHLIWIPNFPLLSLSYTFHTPIGSGHAQWACHSPYKVLSFSNSSDLMKSTVVDESLSSMNLQFCSRENQLLQWDSLFCIPNEPQCYVRQSLVYYLNTLLWCLVYHLCSI